MATSSLSEKEENYVRLSLLLTGISPRAIRLLFDKEFPPVRLKSLLLKDTVKLKGLQFKRVINQAQWNLLFPTNGLPDSKTFDVTLMITLLRNLTSIKHPTGGYDTLPLKSESGHGAELARIKYYRNYLAHLDSAEINTTNFTTGWSDISTAVRRLGGTSMDLECRQLKLKLLDQSNREIMQEILISNSEMKDVKECMEKMNNSLHGVRSSHDSLRTKHDKLQTDHDDLRNDHNTLEASHGCLKLAHRNLQSNHTTIAAKIESHAILHKDTVQWNIRVELKTMLEKWNKKEKMFVETKASKYILKCIKENSCVTVTGSSGVGKTATVQHVALQMAQNGYDVLPMEDPSDVLKFQNPNNKTLFVMDDLYIH